MNFKPTRYSVAFAAIGACLAFPLAAQAADAVKTGTPATVATPGTTAAPMGTATTADARMYNRDHMKTWTTDKEMLQRELAPGHDRAWYVKMLADKGYQITSVNVDKPTEAEYEIVKGRTSYEIQMDFDSNSKMAKKVNVSTNMWRADSTKQALAGKTMAGTAAYAKGNESYSDRGYMKAWSGEKDKLEKQLGTGHDRGYYLAELKKLGYQVTATNDNDKDYVEYEVVKGKNSYEVQVDFENGKSKKVDVATNFWQAEGTDRVMDAKKR